MIRKVMTPERWREVEALFQAALERDPAGRPAFLDQACSGDTDLKHEVESLIAAHEEAGSFIEAAPLPRSVSAEDEPQDSFVNTCIGPYRVVREIGHGGMGSVFLACREDEFRKQVAIKLIRRGMNSELIVRRFRNERQILASLDHPNIARLLDGGTTGDGLPYFVMEFIDGQPIDRYCDEHNLNVSVRLKLFRDVCAAVQFAHQNLVIHRDIKPGNILVTEDGIPRLLDFGIAKLLNPDPAAQTVEQTRTLVKMMTPDYASPEQIRGEPITTATDVYSLGVLLYELLTGRHPFRHNGELPHEVLRAICEDEPEKPSTAVTRVQKARTSGTADPAIKTFESVGKARRGHPDKLRRRLSGDLDNVVLKALQKDPQRRYSSVEQFSEDIRRHLEGLPVIACKDTLVYRAGKFVKRNKAAVAATALVVLALLAGLAATLWQAKLAQAERAKAERRFEDVRKLANSFMFDFHDAIKDLPGSTAARRMLVTQAVEYLDSLAHEASGDLALQLELATAYDRVGDVQGNPYSVNLGDTTGAKESYHKALAIREAIAASYPADSRAQRELALSYIKTGDMLGAGSDTAGSIENYRKALAINDPLAVANPADLQLRRDLALNFHKLGIELNVIGDAGQSLDHHRKALAIREELAAFDPSELQIRRDITVSLNQIAQLLSATGNTSQAWEAHSRVLAIRGELAADDPRNTRAQRDLSLSYERMGDFQARWLGDFAAARDSYLRSLVVRENLFAADPKSALYRKDVAWSSLKYGKMLLRTGDTRWALEHCRIALSLFEAAFAADLKSAQTRGDLSFGYEGMGDVLEAGGDRSGALSYHRKALALREDLLAADPNDTTARDCTTTSYSRIGDLMFESGSASDALSHYRKALAVCEPLSAAEPTNAGYRSHVADSYFRIGKALAKLASQMKADASKRVEQWRQARAWYQRSLDVWQELRESGKLPGEKSSEPAKTSRQIALCDASLAGGPSRSNQ